MNDVSSFVIDKTYFDCVDDDGRAMIGYVAGLSWGGISVPYTSFLYAEKNGATRGKTRFSKPAEPLTGPDEYRWTDTRLGIAGVWRRADPPIQRTLFDSVRGSLHWDCCLPRATATVHVGASPELRGFGYVENLRLTAYPWEIPLETLLWGRYVSSEHSLVWVAFCGEDARQWMFYDGETVSTGDLHDSGIHLPNGIDLEFAETTVLEERGRISAAVEGLRKFVPGFTAIVPDGFRLSSDTKWKSRGILTKGNTVLDRGWVIHERVRFR